MRRRLLVAILAAVVGTILWTPAAPAAPVTKTLSFPLSGSSTTSIFSLGPYQCCDVSVFGEHIGDIHDVTLSLDMDTALSSPTHSDLAFTDTNLRQGRTLDLTNTYHRDSGGKLDVNYKLAFHADVFGIVINPSKTVGDTLPCKVPLPADSATPPQLNCSHATSIDLFNFTVLDLGVGSVKVDFTVPITTTAGLNGNGVTSERTMSVADQPILGPGNLTYTADPDAKDESTFLSCSLPANEPVKYSLGDAGSHVDGGVTENVGLAVGLIGSPIVGPDFDIIPPVTLFSFDLPTVAMNSIDLNAPGQSADLGNLLPNNIPPHVGLATVVGPKVEGKDVHLQASVSSPCGADGLHTVWQFSNPNATEPMVAYGADSHIVFPDNGNWTGTITVSDPTGLSTTKDLGTIVVDNAPPTADTTDKRAEWGDVISYHVNAFDAKADQGSLVYKWSFGDGATATGQDVTHVFSTPLAGPGYAGSVDVTDKDGGVGTASFHTIVDKRPATIVYTGPLSALTKTNVPLSATLADDHGQPVNGGVVSFTLGSQSASGVVDSTGHAATSLLLNQDGTVNYALAVTYGGSALYTSSVATLPGAGVVPANMFRVIKRATTLTYLGDLDQRPNHVALLTARLTDELGQPVVGVTVVFALGSQTIGATTDSTGLASAGLNLAQGPGAYPLTATYAGNGTYQPASAGPMQFSIPRNNGAVAAVSAIANAGAQKAATRVGIRRARSTGGKARHRLVRRRG